MPEYGGAEWRGRPYLSLAHVLPSNKYAVLQTTVCSKDFAAGGPAHPCRCPAQAIAAGMWRKRLLTTAVLASAVTLVPALRIDPAGISVSGISSGADMAVQLQVAYSSLIAGSGIFAGQARGGGLPFWPFFLCVRQRSKS